MVNEVVVLCGGKGKRLREYTGEIPKALVQIGGKPILWHLIKFYSCYGVNKFILCTGYKSEKIEEYVSGEDFSKDGLEVVCVDSGEDATKSQRILKAEPHIKGDSFFVAYGDDLSDVKINKLVEFHSKSKKIATLTAVPLISQFGILDMDDEGLVNGFKEKPKLDHWFNGGFFVFNKKIFEYLVLGELEVEVFEELVNNKELISFKHNGSWKCMNTFKDAEELNNLWANKKAFWKCWED
jgi:glucose-1-phosphate cytidylyltransferase